MENQIKIGLFGFGCVGQGLYDVLTQSKGFRSEIKRIVVKDKNKKRKLPAHYFSYNKEEILNDPEINLIVELIDNADDAFEIVSRALKSGKNVVTANKKMIAEHFEELVGLQNEYGTSLLYEASSCGSIPIIRNLEEYYDNDLLKAVHGIFNGSSNYILTKIQDEGIDYATALKEAQELGFAESNPRLDVEGFDAKYKLIIVAGHTHGVFTQPDEVLNLGIQALTLDDVNYAKSQGKKIRLVATTFKIDEENVSLFVTPRLIDADDPLYNVNREYNAVILEGAFSDKQLIIGKGAGSYPTASAVLSDISANAYSYRYEYKKAHQRERFTYNTNLILEVYLRTDNRELLQDLELIDVVRIDEDKVMAKVHLKKLIRLRDKISASNLFLASTGRIYDAENYLLNAEIENVGVV